MKSSEARWEEDSRFFVAYLGMSGSTCFGQFLVLHQRFGPNAVAYLPYGII